MITQQTAYDIWIAYDEIAKGKALIEKMEEQIKRGEMVNFRDAFGRPRNLQLGIPSGENSHRLYDVKPELATAVIRAHIADKEAVLSALNEVAKAEIGGKQEAK